MSKANAFAALMKEARGHGVGETEKQQQSTETLGSDSKSHKIRGKRDNRDYGKIGVYVRAETITEVKSRLLREKRDLSDLVQDLLDEWLKDFQNNPRTAPKFGETLKP